MSSHLALSWIVLTVVLCAINPDALAGPAHVYPHPLDPLDAKEIARAVRVIRRHEAFPKGAFFPLLVLHEPPKAEVLAHHDGRSFRREAFSVVYDRAQGKTYEVIIDLHTEKILNWKEIPGAEPAVMIEEFGEAAKIVRADSRWQEAMRRRGITKFDEVKIDAWAPGTTGLPRADRGRLVRALFFYQGKSSNPYARPVEGVIAVVDLNHRRVVELIDTGVIPISEDDGALDEKGVGKLRTPVEPLQIVQKRGPSFQIRGHEVRWQKWRFRFSVHPREGLVLHTVGYEDGGEVRSILYRASLSEMLVPYGDPDPNWSWRNAFDVGEYGIGQAASPLERKLDAPDNAVFLAADFADRLGRAYRLPQVVALYERDGGVLWKHYESGTNKNESRRSRELVIMLIATVGNYDYGFSWIFRQDGSMDLVANLTGITLAKGVVAPSRLFPTFLPGPSLQGMRSDGPQLGTACVPVPPQETTEELGARCTRQGSSDPLALGRGIGAARHDNYPYGHLVSKAIVAPHHQHFFNFRLDFDIDGIRNTPVELDTMPEAAGPENSSFNAFRTELTPLKTEHEARRDLYTPTGRKWLMINSSVTNALGHPVGFALIPGENAPPYAHPNAVIRQRAAFVDHQIWFTRFKANEMNAAGPYPKQSGPGQGLAQWISDNESLWQTDSVMWYTFAVTHIGRPEEWPVNPVHAAGFKLIPMGFFSRNPALDVPRFSK
jgi:primary-amine oxidase